MLSAATVPAGGLIEQTEPDGRTLPPPQESLSRADESIRVQRYDDAIPSLVDAVHADPHQLPAAERRFDRIRQARNQYVATGREVETELRELIGGDITPEMVVPTAFQTLRLIARMNEILPFPNPEDQDLINDLQSRVLLTIDRRRFDALMNAAADALSSHDYVRAVDIYVNGLGDYGLGGVGTGRATGTAGEEERIGALLETDGISIQIGSFDPSEYGLTGLRFAAAREAIRRHSVGDSADSFIAVAPHAQEAARQLSESFDAGAFGRALEAFPRYLPLLQRITAIHDAVAVAAESIAEQEALNAERMRSDQQYRYDWHVRFVADIVLGRQGPDGARAAEGTLHAVRSVMGAVADRPVEASRSYAAQRYAEAIDGLRGFRWHEQVFPRDDRIVTSHVTSMDSLLDHTIVSYRTTAEVLAVSHSLEIAVPEPGWTDAASDMIAAVEGDGPIADDELRVVLLEAFARIGSASELLAAMRIAASLYEAGPDPASQTSLPALEQQRSEIRARTGELTHRLDRWDEFASAVGTIDTGSRGPTGSDSVSEHRRYLEGLIAHALGYETAVVRRAAEIRLAELEDRLATLQSEVDTAAVDLFAVDPVSQAPRPRTDAARDRLLPLVGEVSGTNVTDTSGALQALRDDALAIALELRAEDATITSDEIIARALARADSVAATIGTLGDGLLHRAVSLLERALAQVADAEQFERRATERVAEIEVGIAEAHRRNRDGEVLEASRLLDQADDLLSSNNPLDASSLYAASLENWYRPEINAAWDAIRERLSVALNDTRRDIVIARVDLLAASAVPLLDPPPGVDPRPGDAILLLEEADAIWATVYPLIQNPVITPLLRRARILGSQQQQVLSEDIPGFERLSQTLNNARVAFQEADYATARRALAFFLGEQPLNAEARLLDIRLELATGQGTAEAIVQAYINRAFDEVTRQPGDAAAVEAAIRSEQVSTAIFAQLLPLRSKLVAIRQIVDDQGGVSTETVGRIDAALRSIERILNPPPPPPPPDPRRVADQLIDRLPPTATWPDLPVDEQIEIYEELVRVTTILPGYDRAAQLIRLIQSYLPTVRTPTAAEQGIMTRANRLVQQGDFDGALAELERYMALASRDPMLIPDWRTLYNDLIRRLRRQ